MLHVNIKCMNHHTIRIGHGILAFFPWRNFGGQRAGYFHLPMELSQVDRLLLKEMLKSWYSQHLRPQETKRKKTNMVYHGWKDGNQTNLCWKIMLNISWNNHHFIYMYMYTQHVHRVIEIYLYTSYTLMHIHQVLAWWTWQIYSL